MNEVIANLSSGFRYEDIFDIAIVAFIIYRLLLFIHGTRTVQMLIGLGVLIAGYFISNQMELFTTHWLFSNFFDYFVFILIVLFQDDLRRVLTKIGRNPFLLTSDAESRLEMVDEVASATTKLVKDRIGALIVIEQETGLKNFVDTGSKIDAKVRTEILYSIFLTKSPLHDGAVIISGDRLVAAGCFLPLSKNPDIDPQLGTRHRAAIGLTEETDALVVLVSEEANAVHLVQSGKIIKNLSERELRDHLIEILSIDLPQDSIVKRMKTTFSFFRKRGDSDS
jgi:diadenylate cyclase